MRKFFFYNSLVLIALIGISQSFSPDSLSERLAGFDNRKKVDYIIDNFYEIYSADFDQAIYWTKQAINLSKSNDWKEQEAFSYMCHGTSLYLRGDYPEAIKNYILSERLFDSLGHPAGLSRVNNEMAVFYSKNEEYEKAFAALDKSEFAAKKAGDQESLGTSFANRGAILVKQGNYEEAQPFFEEVLTIRTQQKDSVGLGYVYLNFSEYEMFKGNLDASIAWVEKSSIIRQKIGDSQGVAVNNVIMGEIYFNAERYEEAIPYFYKTIELATPIGYTDLIKFTYGMLQKSYVALGRYHDAYENQSRQMAFQDSLLNVEKAKAIAELETLYETEKKEQQIRTEQAKNRLNLFIITGLSVVLLLTIVILLLLRSRSKKKEELLKQQAELQLREAEIEFSIRSQERERARFAKDLHDGFGQLISILNLNLKSLEETKVDRHQVFQNSTDVLNEMYKELKGICFNLMPETLIKNGLPEALIEFASRVNTAGKVHIETDFFGMETRLTDVQEISLYRVTQEWVNNILKYGKASHITIQLTKDDDELTLLIEDNGPGFDPKLLTNSEKGNGWKNILSRVNLIKGELELDTLPDRQGTTFIIITTPQLASKSTNQQVIEVIKNKQH